MSSAPPPVKPKREPAQVALDRDAVILVLFAMVDVVIAITVTPPSCDHCTPVTLEARKIALVSGFAVDFFIVVTAYLGSRGSLWAFAVAIALFVERLGVALWTANFFGFLAALAFVYWAVDGVIVIVGRQRKAAIFSAIRRMQSAQLEEQAPIIKQNKRE